MYLVFSWENSSYLLQVHHSMLLIRYYLVLIKYLKCAYQVLLLGTGTGASFGVCFYCKLNLLLFKTYVAGFQDLLRGDCLVNCQQLTLSPQLVLSERTSARRSKLLVADWSEEDVSEWLVEEGLQGLVDRFKANNMDGTELLRLTKETLASELGIGEEDKCHTRLSECRVTPSPPPTVRILILAFCLRNTRVNLASRL